MYERKKVGGRPRIRQRTVLDPQEAGKFLLETIGVSAGRQPEVKRCIDKKGYFSRVEHPSGIGDAVSRGKNLVVLMTELVVLLGGFYDLFPQFLFLFRMINHITLRPCCSYIQRSAGDTCSLRYPLLHKFVSTR